MPHCIIEYSEELENKIKPTELIDKVYQGTLKSNLFEDEDIKIRTIFFKNHQTGNKKVDFINVTVRILSGRSQKLKTLLSNSILNEFKNINIKPISITIEICEIENESYSKLIF